MTTGVCRVLATRRASVVFAAPSGPSMLTSRRRRAAARSSTTDPRFRRAPPGDPPSGRAVGGQKRRYARPAAPRRQDPAERRAGRFHRLVGEPEQQRPARRGLIVERARPRTPCYPSTIPVAPGHDAQRQPAGRGRRVARRVVMPRRTRAEPVFWTAAACRLLRFGGRPVATALFVSYALRKPPRASVNGITVRATKAAMKPSGRRRCRRLGFGRG